VARSLLVVFNLVEEISLQEIPMQLSLLFFLLLVVNKGAESTISLVAFTLGLCQAIRFLF